MICWYVQDNAKTKMLDSKINIEISVISKIIYRITSQGVTEFTFLSFSV